MVSISKLISDIAEAGGTDIEVGVRFAMGEIVFELTTRNASGQLLGIGASVSVAEISHARGAEYLMERRLDSALRSITDKLNE